MVCYIVPTTAAIAHYFLRRNIPSWKGNEKHKWLSMLLLGGATFGVVDHLWNGELFLIGEKPMIDIMLGIVITLALLFAWIIIVALDRSAVKMAQKIISK